MDIGTDPQAPTHDDVDTADALMVISTDPRAPTHDDLNAADVMVRLGTPPRTSTQSASQHETTLPRTHNLEDYNAAAMLVGAGGTPQVPSQSALQSDSTNSGAVRRGPGGSQRGRRTWATWLDEERDLVRRLLEQDVQAVKSWGDFQEEFNAQFEGRVLEGSTVPRPPRTGHAIQHQAQLGELRRVYVEWQRRRSAREASERATATQGFLGQYDL